MEKCRTTFIAPIFPDILLIIGYLVMAMISFM